MTNTRWRECRQFVQSPLDRFQFQHEHGPILTPPVMASSADSFSLRLQPGMRSGLEGTEGRVSGVASQFPGIKAAYPPEVSMDSATSKTSPVRVNEPNKRLRRPAALVTKWDRALPAPYPNPIWREGPPFPPPFPTGPGPIDVIGGYRAAGVRKCLYPVQTTCSLVKTSLHSCLECAVTPHSLPLTPFKTLLMPCLAQLS
jgi:hypothetical protein